MSSAAEPSQAKESCRQCVCARGHCLCNLVDWPTRKLPLGFQLPASSSSSSSILLLNGRSCWRAQRAQEKPKPLSQQSRLALLPGRAKVTLNHRIVTIFSPSRLPSASSQPARAAGVEEVGWLSLPTTTQAKISNLNPRLLRKRSAG